jgi:hypothetical protein
VGLAPPRRRAGRRPASAGSSLLAPEESYPRSSRRGPRRLDLPLDDEGACEALRERWSRHELELCGLRPASVDEIQATGSTWARRLRIGRERAAWRLELRRR